jgi:transposase InsO family protein
MFGCGYAGLLPFYSRQGNRNRKLSPRTLEIIRATVDAEHKRTPHAWPKVTPVLGKVNLALKEVLLPTVSEKTIARELRHGFRPEEIVAKRDGNRAAYAHRPMYWRLDMDTPLHGQRPFEVGHIDHTLVDIQLIDERFRRKTRKVWATALIDAYDREVLAVFLTFSPPSAASAMAVIRACVKRHGRVPQTIVYDNGKEFKSAAFERLLMALEVAGVARPKGSPKHGAMIERLFRRWNDDLVHNMQGNNVALQTPRMMSASHDPRRNAIWTFDAFHRAFTQYLYEVYPKMLHQGLGVTPLEARDQGLRDFGQRPQDHIKFDEAFELLCMPEHPKELKVQKGGQVRRINLDYQHPDLNDATLIGRKVEVRFDPFDASRILVFAKGKWLIAHCRLQAVFARYTPAEVDRATQRMVELKSWVRSFRSLNAETIASFLCAVEAKEVELIAKKFSRDANVKEAMEAAIKAVRALHDDFFTYVADGTTPEAANDATATEDVEPDADAAAPQPSSLQALFRQQAAA